MGKQLTKITSDVQEVFDSVLVTTNLDNFITFDILSDNTLKKEGYKVQKSNDVLKFYSDADVIILVNENVFDKLDAEAKELLFVEALAGVSYDSEKDKLTVAQPDFTSHSGVIAKYGFDAVYRMKELIKSALIIEDQEGEE